MSAFAVDKQRSLEIIQSILNSNPLLDDRDGEKKIYEHKLAFARLFLNDQNEPSGIIRPYFDPNLGVVRILGIDNYSDLLDHTSLFIEESQKGPDVGYNLCENPEIAKISIEGDTIVLNDVMISEDDSDWSICFFKYDCNLKTWIHSGVPEAPKGIDHRGCVTILDFREYEEA